MPRHPSRAATRSMTPPPKTNRFRSDSRSTSCAPIRVRMSCAPCRRMEFADTVIARASWQPVAQNLIDVQLPSAEKMLSLMMRFPAGSNVGVATIAGDGPARSVSVDASHLSLVAQRRVAGTGCEPCGLMPRPTNCSTPLPRNARKCSCDSRHSRSCSSPWD